MTQGIYTLANDVVYDQLVALLNSIEANVSPDIPVCIIPYDDNLDRVRAEVANRPQVTIFEDLDSIRYWEAFGTQVWNAHSTAKQVWQEKGWTGIFRLERHRKLCCLDGPFEKFIYFDADTLALSPLDQVYDKLDHYDWVTNDFQHLSDFNYIFDCSQPQLHQIFPAEKLASHIFCSGWFASRRGIFTPEKIQELLGYLEAGEADVMAWRDSDQTVLNYLVLRGNLSYYNFAFEPHPPGSHWSSNFEQIGQILYDQGKPLTYLHYMSVSSSKFRQLCEGKDIELPYRDLFLHYRYLKAPHERPQTFTRPPLLARLYTPVKQAMQQKVVNAQHKLRQHLLSKS